MSGGIVTPITLVTGLPGSGKTAHVVDLIANHPDFKGRPLFCMGIPELKVEHVQVPPLAEWTELRPSVEDPSLMEVHFTFPVNAVIVIDEAQRVWRPRASGSKVPDHVQAFETVRHGGVDFILLTQSPSLIDSNLRRLVGRHIHIHVQPLGRSLLEWRGCRDPESSVDRGLAIRKKYAPPKRVFGLYKSSEKHTKISVRMPWQYYAIGIAALSVVGLGYYGFQRVSAKTVAPAEVQASGSSGGSASKSLPVADYIKAYQPRIAGLVHTAPIYDEVTKPVEVPWPAACIKTAKRCVCYDQQGGKYPTTDNICGQIIEKGMFKPFESRDKGGSPPPSQASPLVALAKR